jgi:hypothetical protein
MTKVIKLESIESLDKIRQKITTRQIDFSKDELLHLEEVYTEIQKQVTGKVKILDKGCSSCISSAANIVYNYVMFHEPKEIDIEATLPIKEVETVIKEVSGKELEDLSLTELRTLYPNIKSTSVAKFIEKVRALETTKNNEDV